MKTAGGGVLLGRMKAVRSATGLLRTWHRGLASGSTNAPPVIDLHAPREHLVSEVADACSRWGFFQVGNHGIDDSVISAFSDQMTAFFDLPLDSKRLLRRSASNARGFFDDELTKQKLDWKQALDFGVPGSRNWSLADGDPANACLDGFNRVPERDSLPHFRSTMVSYFAELVRVSELLASVMAEGLGMPASHFDRELRDAHTSYLRLNYYPPNPGGGETLGISPHRDAGFLTVLWQDPDTHSLQVQQPMPVGSVGRYDGAGGEWTTVIPVKGALTINTGDMAQIWSNNRYHAPLHRVLTHPTWRRYSAPFFYNPGYRTQVAPLPSLGKPTFTPCNWGYFRAQRFAGDFADFGAEIQVDDYLEGSVSRHLHQQIAFERMVDFRVPFSVEQYRSLLVN
eukprot:CAMPEP_0119299614 /NCGR_PEP_ID=MMETSP1333-20130426/1592_1 /TAXON_ID=418940 /ORGANISM="Scyphosphaera apsteinii, Strain RCC1455" /LENGTH=396 /DNA_ID=CAMNT_0007301095 /DNA_START=1 /DNA_END=1191 /DNA_ORIENTATION=+